MKIRYFLLSLLALSVMACSEDGTGDPNPTVPQTVVPTNPVAPNDPSVPEDPDLSPGVDHEWDENPVCVVVPDGKKWELQEQSDEFNTPDGPYDTETFLNGKWKNYYHAHWPGPAPTYWKHDHVWIADSNLKIKVTRPQEAKDMLLDVENGDEKVQMPATFTGCVTGKDQVTFPAYIEARAKLSKATMASDVWMLSDDNTREIDIIEAYGADRNTGTNAAGEVKSFMDNTYLHLSHHVFIREPLQDYQPTMSATWYQKEDKTVWSDDYHTVGVFWRDAWNLEYYVDGKLVRVVKKDLIDPLDYTSGGGLDQALNVIINMEDQSWRAIGGMSPTEEELADEENCIFNVDWIRIYKLVDDVPATTDPDPTVD